MATARGPECTTERSDGSLRAFAAVLAALPERVYRVRRDGRVIAVWGTNDGREPLYEDCGVGRNVRELLAPDPADGLARTVDAAVRGVRTCLLYTSDAADE